MGEVEGIYLNPVKKFWVRHCNRLQEHWKTAVKLEYGPRRGTTQSTTFTLRRRLLVLEYLDEVVGVTVGHDEVLVHVDRDALRRVDVRRDDPLECARRAGAVTRPVHDDTAVTLVGDQQVGRPVETESPRPIELVNAGTNPSTVPVSQQK